MIWKFGLHDYQRRRVITFIDPRKTPKAPVTRLGEGHGGPGGLLGKGFQGGAGHGGSASP